MLFALLGSRSLHRDPLVCAPGPILSGGRLIHPPDTSMDVLAAWGGIRPYRDLPFPGLIDEPAADLQLHRQHARLGRRCRLSPRSRPSPMSRRPSLSRSTVAISSAIVSGWCSGTTLTAVPTRM